MSIHSKEFEYFGPRFLGFLFICVALVFLLKGDSHTALSQRTDALNTKGSGAIILTAPHGISHMRDGREKQADANTTTIVNRIAGMKPNTFLSISWKQRYAKDIAREQGWKIDDPNYIPLSRVRLSPFFIEISSRVKNKSVYNPLLVDIHGMKNVHDGEACDVALGFGAWRSSNFALANTFVNCILTGFKSRFEPKGFRIGCLTDVFTGNKNRERISVTRTAVVLLGIPAFQVELSQRLRALLSSSQESLLEFASTIEQCHRSVLQESTIEST